MKMYYNELNVKGKGQDIKSFIADNYEVDCETGNVTFMIEQVIPSPFEAEGNLSDEWVKWRIDNWGYLGYDCSYSNNLSVYDVEKGIDIPRILNKESIELIKDDVESKISSSFETLGGAPVKIYEELRDNYSDTDLEFDTLYHTDGHAGCYNFSKGEITDIQDYNMLYDDVGKNCFIGYYNFVLESGLEGIYGVADIIDQYDCVSEKDRLEYMNRVDECTTSQGVSELLYEFNQHVINIQKGGK